MTGMGAGLGAALGKSRGNSAGITQCYMGEGKVINGQNWHYAVFRMAPTGPHCKSNEMQCFLL